MRVIIIDDEALARQDLLYLLKDFSDIDVVAEAANIHQGELLIRKLQPDLVFLDINMPMGTGFDLLEILENPPGIVFTTAYSEYAVQAFDAQAWDYLLKPIESGRLTQALNRCRDEIKQSPENRLIKESILQYEDRILAKDRGKSWLIPLRDIILFQSQGNYTQIFFADQHPMIKRTLSQIEQRLPDKRFLRANRQQIVNIESVQTIEPDEPGRLQLHLGNDCVVNMSRRQARIFRELSTL